MTADDKNSKYFLNWRQAEKGASLSFLGPGILQILDALPFYVMLIDKNHRILLANKATREALGLEPHDIIGEYCPRVVHGIEEGAYPGCPLEKAVAKGSGVEQEFYDEKEGRWLRVAIYPTGTWSVDGQEIYFHMVQDITEQKQEIEALKQAKETYRKLYEKSKKR